METFLFDQIVFGPVQSRRLGVSLGINLLPTDSKLCNFNCIYCECGWSKKFRGSKAMLPNPKTIYTHLKEKLIELKKEGVSPDSVTFAGNGEPTLHPDFPEIIRDSRKLVKRYFPEAKLCVLTNGTLLHIPAISTALKKVDQCMIKFDAGTEELFKAVNDPIFTTNLDTLVQRIMRFKGQIIIQSMFYKTMNENNIANNSTDKSIKKWLALIKKINPAKVLLYSIDRATPEKGLEKVSREKLEEIAEMLSLENIRSEVY